jgi:putative component of toxin-antitoxin plasmid stabilization module
MSDISLKQQIDMQDGNKIILLLCAGDKRTQTADIERGKEFRSDYERRKK